MLKFFLIWYQSLS